MLTGDHPLLGDRRPENAVPLRYADSGHWQVELSLDAPQPGLRIGYEYILRNPDGSLVPDWGRGRFIEPTRFQEEEVVIVDTWNHAGSPENALYTKPFKQVLLKDHRADLRLPGPPNPTHTLRVRAPLLTQHQTLCLLGEPEVLGHWNTSKPVLLNRAVEDDFLSVQLDLRNQSFPIAYKYAVYDTAKHAFVRYEEGENRLLSEAVAANRHTVVNDGFVALPANTWKGAGVAIPVFSLRSEKSFGVGEFSDLELLADWGQQVGLRLIQLLPINDTSATFTWMDSYPYSAISAFALHPLYLNLGRMAEGSNRALLESLEPERQRLNALEDLDYQAVIRAKLDFVRRVFPSQKQKTFRGDRYRDFFKRNEHWLAPYAAFCCLRDKYGTADFNQWPAEHRRCQERDIANLSADGSPARDEIALHYFIQFHLHCQLAEAVEHARAKGIVVKGDLPIGVFRYGADAWQNPDLYHMEFQAGAPPDAFSETGQNWSFPTYNWPRMKADGYAWWKRRLEQMSCYFDAFRVDHILGFFRIWSIPWDAVEGFLGFFVPALPVELQEFQDRGIWFDHDRYTRPYITDDILEDLFENDYAEVERAFLERTAPGRFALKPEFATQRNVERHFAALEDNERNRGIKQGLFELIGNVLLLEAPGSNADRFHFRFFIDHTRSFKGLPPHAQRQLTDLYVDYFFRRQETLWRREGLEKLPALKRATDMLVCGEDLGLVPACVPEVMKQLGLLSLEVQRMPKTMGREFARLSEAPYLSVVTPSTHDISTIRGWWEEDRKVTQKFWNEELGQPGEAPAQCEAWINKAIVRQHLMSPAMWSLFQLQDLLGMDEKLRRADPNSERINVPSNPKYYWRYRMHLTLEALLRAEDFNRELKESIRQGGR
jgi:4-alpha-glucanotransferase